MGYNLLRGKRGIIFGALDENSIAWKTALKVKEEGGQFTLTNAPIAMRMGKIKELGAACQAEIIPADATIEAELTNLFTKSVEVLGGKLDFVLHSIGMSPNVRKEKSYGDLNYDWFQKTLDISGLSFHKVLQTAEKTDAMNEWGSILALTYIAAQRSYPDYSDMAQAKAVLESIARSYGHRFATLKKVRVNTISQSPTVTTAGAGISGFDVFFDYAKMMSPLGNASAEDCANYIVLMFSDYSRMVTMQNLMHDGGFSSTGITQELIDRLERSNTPCREIRDMVTFPPCKINLGLQILSRRDDGYHDIRTGFFPIPCTDVLEILPSEEMAFTQSGVEIPGIPENNNCLKAYHLLKRDFKLQPVTIHLHKIIPPGGGLGGGSSDAAYTLRSLASIFNLNILPKQMEEYALAVGSDCPFFLQDQPMIGSGRGEKLETVTIDLKGFFVVVIVPPIHVSTAEAYARVKPSKPVADLREVLLMSPKLWKEALKNDFEESVFKRFPDIGKLKEKLYSLGALYSSLSGSGSAVFAIFEKEIRWRDHFQKAWGWSQWI